MSMIPYISNKINSGIRNNSYDCNHFSSGLESDNEDNHKSDVTSWPINMFDLMLVHNSVFHDRHYRNQNRFLVHKRT